MNGKNGLGWFLIIGLALLGVMCASCGGAAPTSVRNGGVAVSDGNGAATLYPVTASDGTKCIALVGYQKGALSCDWGKKE